MAETTRTAAVAMATATASDDGDGDGNGDGDGAMAADVGCFVLINLSLRRQPKLEFLMTYVMVKYDT